MYTFKFRVELSYVAIEAVLLLVVTVGGVQQRRDWHHEQPVMRNVRALTFVLKREKL